MASLTLGALSQTDWFVVYVGMLFGFAVVVGFRLPRPITNWILVLALGAPIAALVHDVFYGPSTIAWYADLFLRTGAALAVILPGVGAGLVYRRLRKRLRRVPAA